MRTPLIMPVLALLLCGCRPGGPQSAGRFSRPPEGVVRVLFTRVNANHIKWTLLGERNWRTPAAQGSSLSLTGVYPLNAAGQRGGCHTWELDLTVTESRWKATLHGSNGATAESEGPRSGELSLRIDQDTDLRLPAETTFATIGAVPLRLTVPR